MIDRQAQRSRWSVLLVALGVALAGCDDPEVAAPVEPRPVRSVVVAKTEGGETVSVVGTVEAQNEAALAFRIGGRIVERSVSVGDRVEAGQVLARLDPLNELGNQRSAAAALTAAESALTKTRNAFQRQQTLLADGFTTRARFDEAEKALRTAQAQVDSARAQLEIADDRVGFTELVADAEGTITARLAESGEVVQPGQPIFRIARQDGRDAVFDLPANLIAAASAEAGIEVALVDDPSVTAIARVREVAPQADPATRNFRVRAGLDKPPVEMRLGSIVAGRLRLDGGAGIDLPASALVRVEGQPSVWVVDPADFTVSIRAVEVLRDDPGTVQIGQGLNPGEIVVTAGVQALHPGQKVRLLGATP